MGLYTGFDLHSSNSYIGVIDEDGRRMWKKKLRNDPRLILATLKPFIEDIEGVVVEFRSIRDSSMVMTNMMHSGLPRC